MAKAQTDLNSMTAQELTVLIDEATAKRAEKQQQAKTSLIEEMTTKAAELGLSLDAIIGKQAAPQTNVRKVRTDKGGQVPVKYRGPDDATWTGRGRWPRWLTNEMERGKKKEDFVI